MNLNMIIYKFIKKKVSSLSPPFLNIFLLIFRLFWLFLGHFEIELFLFAILNLLKRLVHHFLSISRLFVLLPLQFRHLHTNIALLNALLSLLPLLLGLFLASFLVESSPGLRPCKLNTFDVMLEESVHFSINEEVHFSILRDEFFTVSWVYFILTILACLGFYDHCLLFFLF